MRSQGLNPIFGDLGKLVRMNPAGGWSYMADVSAYEGVANPDGGVVRQQSLCGVLGPRPQAHRCRRRRQ